MPSLGCLRAIGSDAGQRRGPKQVQLVPQAADGARKLLARFDEQFCDLTAVTRELRVGVERVGGESGLFLATYRSVGTDLDWPLRGLCCECGAGGGFAAAEADAETQA